MSCQCQIIFNHPLGSCVNRNEADLSLLAFDTKMHDTLSAVQVLHPQTTEFFAPDTVIQQCSQDGPISDALERARGRRFQQFASLHVAERLRAAFVPVGHWPFHSVHRIAGDSVAFAEVIEERRERRELAPNRGRRQTASFHVLAPGNNMRTAYGT